MKSQDGIRSRKIRRVIEYVQNALLPLPYGGRLPGMRTIMAQTGAGQRTVTRALQQLAQERLIRIDPGRGSYRTDPAGKSDEIRLLHWSINSLDGKSFVTILFRTLEKLATQANRKLTIENVRGRSWENIGEELVSREISRVILFGAMSPDFAVYLQKRMAVCLELLPEHTKPVITELRESPEMISIQFHYLWNLGYRRIGYLHFGGNDISEYPLLTKRLLDYYRLMAEHHLYVNPAWVFHCQERYENLGDGMDRMMAAEPPPEALIVPSSALVKLYGWCRKHRIRIGKDLAVFCVDEINWDLSPEVTAVTNNPMEIAQVFWAMFQAAERGEKVESRYTKLFIRTGQSVPALKPL